MRVLLPLLLLPAGLLPNPAFAAATAHDVAAPPAAGPVLAAQQKAKAKAIAIWAYLSKETERRQILDSSVGALSSEGTPEPRELTDVLGNWPATLAPLGKLALPEPVRLQQSRLAAAIARLPMAPVVAAHGGTDPAAVEASRRQRQSRALALIELRQEAVSFAALLTDEARRADGAGQSLAGQALILPASSRGTKP